MSTQTFRPNDLAIDGKSTVGGKTYVLIEAGTYKAWRRSKPAKVSPTTRTSARAVDAPALPALPKPNARGNLPALEAARVNIARNIITRRVKVGLSQRALAHAADIRAESLNRIERAKVTADTATITKIDSELLKRERSAKSK